MTSTGDNFTSIGSTGAYETIPLPDSPEAYLQTVVYRDYELTGSDEPYYMGRWFEKEIAGDIHMVSVTDGSMVYFLVKGSLSVEITFSLITNYGTPQYCYSIDGEAPVRQSINKKTIPLPDDDYHTVRIIMDGMAENEGKWENEKGFAIKSIIPMDGGVIYGIRPTGKIIFYYGDSITQGTNSRQDGRFMMNNSATTAYPWFCSENLNAVMYSIGYGGSGIVREGSFRPMCNAITHYSANRPVEKSVLPDVIVINHGHNDKAVTDTVFREKLVETLILLQNVYPDAQIVYVIPFNQSKADIIINVMQNISNGYVIATAGWNLTTTDGVHLDAAGAEKAGLNIAENLLTLLGQEFFCHN